MNATMVTGFLFVLGWLGCEGARAADWTINVPVDISNLPDTVGRVGLQCNAVRYPANTFAGGAIQAYGNSGACSID